VSSKVLIFRLIRVFSVFLLFVVANVFHYRWWDGLFIGYNVLSILWISVILLICGGILLAISPEILFRYRSLGFNDKKFLLLAFIPIITLIYIMIHWSFFPTLIFNQDLPPYLIWYLQRSFGVIVSPIWLGVAIGKSLYIKKQELEAIKET
jgi:hypothetical protein